MKDDKVTMYRVTGSMGSTELPVFYVPVDNRYADSYAVAQEKAFLVLTAGQLAAPATFTVTNTESGKAHLGTINLHPGGVMQFLSAGPAQLDLWGQGDPGDRDPMHYSATDSDAELDAKAAPVLAEYQRLVKENGTERAVAFDVSGFAGVEGEIIEQAERMGYSFPDDESNEALHDRLITRVKDWQLALQGQFPEGATPDREAYPNQSYAEGVCAAWNGNQKL